MLVELARSRGGLEPVVDADDEESPYRDERAARQALTAVR
jgi:hypothetical protein